MKRKILFLCVIMMMFCVTAFANYSIIVEGVQPKPVQNYIIQMITTNPNINCNIETASDSYVTFLSSKPIQNIMFVGNSEDRITFTTTPSGNNTIVSVTETVKVLRNNGTLMSAVTPKDANIIFPMFLNAIKAYFNGHYWFGYDMSKKAEGGYMIDEIYPGMPFDKAGIKIGDIILTINGQEVKNVVEKKIKAVRFTDIFSPDPVNFVIKQNGVEKHYTIVPAFKEADYKPVSTKKE